MNLPPRKNSGYGLGWTRPALTPAMQASSRFTYPRGMEGWVDLVEPPTNSLMLATTGIGLHGGTINTTHWEFTFCAKSQSWHAVENESHNSFLSKVSKIWTNLNCWPIWYNTQTSNIWWRSQYYTSRKQWDMQRLTYYHDNSDTCKKVHISTTYSLHWSTTSSCNYYSKWQKCHRKEQNVYTCPQLTAVYQSWTILINIQV